ncbi:MAG: head GIN domain-containing protein [Pirellulaceae bacterium]
MFRIAGFVCALMIACAGCDLRFMGGPKVVGSGVIKTETRTISDFERIEFKGGGKIEFAAGDATKCEVEIDDNILGLITTEVVDGTLVISNTESYQTSKGLTVRLATKSLTGVSISGGCDFIGTGLDADQFKINVTGSGDLKLKGQAKKLSINISGSGDIRSEEFAVDDVSVNIQGSGSFVGQANKTLNVEIAGSGSVDYTGDATVTKQILGSGTVRKK